MDAVLTEEQTALAEAATALAETGLAGARTMLDGGERPARPTIDLFEGFNGLGIDEAAGGAGGGLVDLSIVARALGRTVVPTPWTTHQMALHAARAAGLDLADGMDPAARWVLVDGASTAVRDGDGAQVAVVLEGDGVQVCPVTGATPLASFDPSRPMADLTLGEPVSTAATGAASARLRARTIVAAGLTGTGVGAVERAADYATEREQFGKVVGIFQGVSHQLADAWTAVELAWSLVLFAAWAVDEGEADAAQAVDAAVAKAGSAAILAAERGMQVHGGLGITWEADPHLALRRAMGDDAWLGNAREAEIALGRALLVS